MESEDYTSYMEKSLAKEMCIKFKLEEISTTGEDCSKVNSKEKEVRALASRLDEAIRKAIHRLSTRESKTRSGPCNRCK